eukprot:4992308-Ditylum_brightwellii.AAC.1
MRKNYKLNGSSKHKYFLQCICSTAIGQLVPLLYPEGVILSVLPVDKASLHGFASLPQHVRAKNDSALLSSIDSKEMVKNLCALQKIHKMDNFFTFTCNQRKYFGTLGLKEWLESHKWGQYYEGFEKLTFIQKR